MMDIARSIAPVDRPWSVARGPLQPEFATDIGQRATDPLGDSQTPAPITDAQIDQHVRTEKAVATWVGQSFFATMLKQAREGPFKDELFSGGRGGDAFKGQLDLELAQRGSAGVAGSLVASIVKRIEGPRRYDAIKQQIAQQAEETPHVDAIG